MDLSNDPEIICVFCGLGFVSVENVELHIHENHQANNIDQIENKRTSIIDDYSDQIISDGNFLLAKEMKENNTILLQKDIKPGNYSQEVTSIDWLNTPNKTIFQSHRKKTKIINLMRKKSKTFIEEEFQLEKNDLSEHKPSPMFKVSEIKSNHSNKVEKIMKRSLRCQNCDKQFTLSNNLSRHRRLYCSSLKENNSQNNYYEKKIKLENSSTSDNSKFELFNKPDDISKETRESDSCLVKKVFIKSKASKPLLKYKCRKCYKKFIFKISQIIHLQNHEMNDNRKWKCEKCGFKYTNKGIHFRQFGSNCVALHSLNSCLDINNSNYTESNKCQFCKINFTNSIYLEMHQMKVCHKSLANRSCLKTSHNNKLRTESIKIRRKNMAEILKDEVSSDLFITNELSSRSRSGDQSVFEGQSSPRSPENVLNGNSKNDSIVNNVNQKFHWHNYNEEIQQKSFQCEICKKSFSSRSSLSNHIKSHYSSRGQPFTCRDCNRRFINLISLQDHRREMCSQKSNEAEQKASYGLSNFNGVSQVHIWPNISNSNSGTQPVTCLHCNGVFYDRLELEEHALTKHSNEQGNILCLLCDRSFTTNMALRVHLTKSHGFANGGCPGVSQNLPPMPKLETNYHIGDEFPFKKRRKDKRLFVLDKEYSCDNCNRNFSTGQALGNHKRACLNMTNEYLSVENKLSSQNSKSNSKLHSIESLIFDNASIRSSFANDKNVFLAFN